MILAKFARARNLDVAQAADMLTATLRWRDEFQLDAVMREEFDPEVFGKLGVVFGKDKEGRPVTYNLYGAVKDLGAVFGDVQKFIRCVVGWGALALKVGGGGVLMLMVCWRAGGACSLWSRASSCSTSRRSTRWCRSTVCHESSLRGMLFLTSAL